MTLKIGKLIRSRRKTISAEINPDAELVIRAPGWVSEKFITDFIQERKSWILKHQSLALEKKKTRPDYQYIEGEKFLFLGKYYPLRIGEFPQSRLRLVDGEFCLSALYANQARKELIAWYKEQAALEISGRADMYALEAGVQYQSIRINQAARQWGSCTAGNNLSFTWRLIMAPLFVEEAVVVHELMHIKEKNHSRAFWNAVKNIYPQYDQVGKWLDANSHLLHL